MGVLSALAAAGHTLTQFPPVWPALGLAFPAVWSLSVAGAGLLWAFVTELFTDRRRVEPLRFAPAALLLIISVSARGNGKAEPELWLLHNAVGGAFMLHALLVIGTGWRNDLVDARRRLRGPVMAAAAVYAVAVIAVQAGEIVAGSASRLSPVAAGALLALGLASLAAFLRPDADLFAAPAPAAPGDQGATQALSAEEAQLAERLDRLLREERIYRREGLTVGGLALALKTPEYRLRPLINQRLGHRNFAAFINQWRLAEAREALGDPAQRAVPVATIALDAGFQSLGPFNRAFKAETGLTPTEFRQRAIG